MLVLVGNAPSSGSTMLADLLDSTARTASGPELGMFATRYFYSWGANILRTSSSSCLYLRRCGLNPGVLHSYGLNRAGLLEMIRSSNSPVAFSERFARHFLILRGKDPEGVVFEKTPENVNCLEDFLRISDTSRFVHIARNPLYVASSLRKRGFPSFVALATWFVDVARYLPFASHPRVFSVRYEDLVQSPFPIVASIIAWASGRDIDPAAIEAGFSSNPYRELHETRIASWGSKGVGRIVNANTRSLPEEECAAMAAMLGVKIGRRYGRRFGLPEVSFAEVLRKLGYHNEVMAAVRPYLTTVNRTPAKDLGASILLIRKWLTDFVHGEAAACGPSCYLNPIEPVSDDEYKRIVHG